MLVACWPCSWAPVLAGFAGKLPGVEPAPYILRFEEDRPNPLYRRICYTLAWSEVISYALLNIAAGVDAIIHGVWRTRAIYDTWYFPIAITIWVLGALGQLPRVKRSTKGEGRERRYFYGSVWAVCIAQPALWFLWKVLPQSRSVDVAEAGRVPRYPWLRRQSLASRPAPEDPPDPSGRMGWRTDGRPIPPAVPSPDRFETLATRGSPLREVRR